MQKKQVWAILAHTNATKAVFELQADPNRDPARGQASENPQPKTSPFKAKCLEPKWLRTTGGKKMRLCRREEDAVLE